MEAYTMKSDKTFLRCLDTRAIEVYELDSPYLFPVKGKQWSHLGISIGPGHKYEVLRIGDKDIRGDDLQALIRDLFNSRLIINREGLGFLPAAGVTVVVMLVEYYRLFDLFDWSKYQVNTSLNTKWARSNFIDGRPLDILGSNPGNGSRDDTECKKKLGEKDKELENQKIKHKEELEEVKRRKEEGSKETKEKINNIKEVLEAAEEELKDKQNKIDKLKEELAGAERIKQKELKKKQDEIDTLKEELAGAERINKEELKKKQDEIDKLKEELVTTERKNMEESKDKQNKIDKLKVKLDEAERRKREELKDKEDDIDKLKDELEEAEQKRQQDLKKKQDEIEILKEALEEAERKLKKKHDEIDRLKVELAEEKRNSKDQNDKIAEDKKKINELEEELKLHVYLRSGLRGGFEFLYNLVQVTQRNLPSSKLSILSITQAVRHKGALSNFQLKVEHLHDPLIVIGPILDSMSDFPTQLIFRPESFYSDFDLNNWRVVRVIGSSKGGSVTPFAFTIAFYDGNKYQKRSADEKHIYPIPCHYQHLSNYTSYSNGIYNILGVGLRYSIACFVENTSAFLYT
ncbi:hypothetical protein SOVF_057600 [Spinacia oleracea]|uniref:DNA ligase 1-like n=1 Tax=Spinacia oleracea TaxID=3562 RepID=A0A9R0JXG1_SPIOL|nr:uncharacterized protein LOC110789729 [Spinacia oleracea]XP_056695795.1 uncharacterized protein LOC110789729 [Spinacia oleracea]KNA19853.1 hypothetical protein SOVF_057600 [Spinacia oleracea]